VRKLALQLLKYLPLQKNSLLRALTPNTEESDATITEELVTTTAKTPTTATTEESDTTTTEEPVTTTIVAPTTASKEPLNTIDLLTSCL